MVKPSTTQFSPDYLVTPGEVVAEYLGGLGMTQADFARRAGLTVKSVKQIIRGEAVITPEMALQLGCVLGGSAQFWNNLERCFQERRGRLTGRALQTMKVSSRATDRMLKTGVKVSVSRV